MSSNPFEPPQPQPEPLPPNRIRPQSARRSLGIWVLLIALFVGVHFIFSPDKPISTKAIAPPVEVAPVTMPLGWLAPAAFYGFMVIGLFVLRAKLPDHMRRFELRTVAAKPSEKVEEKETKAPAKVRPIRLDGSNGTRPVRLEVNDEGIHWYAEATAFLHGATELRVAWSELESVTIHHRSLLMTWIAIIVAVFYAFMAQLTPVLVAAGMAVVLYFIENKRPSGILSFVTPTHSLSFQSRQLDEKVGKKILKAVRTHKPTAAPNNDSNSSAFRMLILDPLVQFKDAFASNAALDEKSVTDSTTTIDEKTRASSRIQVRMFSLWSGTMRGVGPLAFGVGTALAVGHRAAFAIGWLGAWILGLIIVTRFLKSFARFSGLSIQQ